MQIKLKKDTTNGVWELRITTGPGYRVYYSKKDDKIVILLVGGDKSTQNEDIAKAKYLLKDIEDDQTNNI